VSYLTKIKGINISKYDHGVGEYHQGWEACDQYAYNVVMGITPTGHQAKMACARYIYDRETRKDLIFDTKRANHIIRFAGLLKHVKGPLIGKPVKLLNWMIFVLCNIFGWYYINGSKKGQRRFTRAFTLVARSNAKSFLCSIVALYIQRTSPNGSPECISVARQKEQARIVFDDACKMLRSSDIMLKRWFESNTTRMTCIGNDGTFKPMSQDSQSLDGHRVALGIADELHAHHTPDLLNGLISGISGTTDPLIFAISTAGTNLDGICVTERNLVRDINEDMVNMDSYFGIEYALDDKDDWEDENNWHKANPSLGHSTSIDELRNELIRAQGSPQNRKNFLTKYCNIFVNTTETPFLDLLEVQTKCARDNLHLKPLMNSGLRKDRKLLYLGLDLAQVHDIAALSFLFPEDDGSVSVIQRHYFPEGALHKLSAAHKIMYEQFEEDGNLILTQGTAIDFEYIKKDILMAQQYFDLKMVGYDPWKAAQLAIDLESSGIDMVEVRQGMKTMSEPSKLFQKLISDGKFNYQKTDKCLEWQIGNAAVKADLNENIKVQKSPSKPHNKVDSVIAIITGLAIAKIKVPKPESPYKKRNMTVL
jgi:phage terminase large subunit-like protein